MTQAISQWIAEAISAGQGTSFLLAAELLDLGCGQEERND
jgi:hypothetical protein